MPRWWRRRGAPANPDDEEIAEEGDDIAIVHDADGDTGETDLDLVARGAVIPQARLFDDEDEAPEPDLVERDEPEPLDLTESAEREPRAEEADHEPRGLFDTPVGNGQYGDNGDHSVGSGRGDAGDSDAPHFRLGESPRFVRLPTGTVERSEPGQPWWRYERPEVRGWDSDQRSGSGSARTGAHPASAVALIDEHDEAPAPETATEPADLGPEPQAALGMLAGIFAALVALILIAIAHGSRYTHIGRVLVPIFGLLVMAAVAPVLRARHRDEPWLVPMMYWGVAYKLVMSFARYYTLVDGYGNVGDATEYGKYATAAILGTAKPLPNLRKSNFIRWFTAVVYRNAGIDIVTGFLIFGLIAVIGSYFWYRAYAESVPFGNKKMFLAFILFLPSIAFWPSSIGKEALMQFGLGCTALGAAKLLNQKLVRGLLIAVPGGWVLWLVRPHLLAFTALATGMAYVIGRRRTAATAAMKGSLVRPIGLIVVGLLAVWTVTQAASFLGMKDLSLNSIEQTLSEQTAQTSQGGSQIDVSTTNGKVHLTPLSLPQGAVTVLLRPFPWEVTSKFQIIASLEAAFLTFLIVKRWRSMTASLREIRVAPFLFYCWVMLALYSITFSSFANMGLLVRQRSLVLPALVALICVEPSQVAAWKPSRSDPGMGHDRVVV